MCRFKPWRLLNAPLLKYARLWNNAKALACATLKEYIGSPVKPTSVCGRIIFFEECVGVGRKGRHSYGTSSSAATAA